MPVRYTPLPSQRSAQDADIEMDAAFESDDERESENVVKANIGANQATTNAPTHELSAVVASADPLASTSYDFEHVYNYDYPPPGSPPRPSALALPNAIGNSNGHVPTSPVVRPSLDSRAMGFLRRLLPTRYSLLPSSSEHTSRRVGGGLDNDGVFANVVAKPVIGAAVEQSADGIYVVPEETQKEAPPSYQVAAADAVPPYWETTVLAPSSPSSGDMIVDSLATGSMFSFLWNMLISLSFNFVGFLLTYLLHTTHAAKFGSRAGLGITLLQYGFALRKSGAMMSEGTQSEQDLWPWQNPDDLATEPMTSEPSYANSSLPSSEMDSQPMVPYPQEWIAFLLMTLGWFLLLTSFLGFWRVKRWEREIRNTAAPQPALTAEAIERDRLIRVNLERVFGMGLTIPTINSRDEWDVEQGRARVMDDQMRREDDQLRQDLAAAGLI